MSAKINATMAISSIAVPALPTKWAIIVLRQNQYQNSHDQISQADDDQHPPWNDVRHTQSKNAAEDQQTIGNRIENLPDFAHLIE